MAGGGERTPLPDAGGGGVLSLFPRTTLGDSREASGMACCCCC